TDGENFGKLVKEYTDDSPPGIYEMANFGETNVPQGVYERKGMVAAFGNVGFPLPVGGVGLAVYDPQTSPYGWHIIKRIK
ncbi:MAG: peptidyl-prolyl cis-trans isomerase, partial [Mariniblastus sp.]|nr:peptidyl-prolyl cis-trans isomerase [Mariniblastus sp.]